MPKIREFLQNKNIKYIIKRLVANSHGISSILVVILIFLSILSSIVSCHYIKKTFESKIEEDKTKQLRESISLIAAELSMHPEELAKNLLLEEKVFLPSNFIKNLSYIEIVANNNPNFMQKITKDKTPFVFINSYQKEIIKKLFGLSDNDFKKAFDARKFLYDFSTKWESLEISIKNIIDFSK